MSNSDIEIEYRRMKGETIDSNVTAQEIKPSVISSNTNASLLLRKNSLVQQKLKVESETIDTVAKEPNETVETQPQRFKIKNPSMISRKKPPLQTQKQSRLD